MELKYLLLGGDFLDFCISCVSLVTCFFVKIDDITNKNVTYFSKCAHLAISNSSPILSQSPIPQIPHSLILYPSPPNPLCLSSPTSGNK